MTAGPADQYDVGVGGRRRPGELAGDLSIHALLIQGGTSPGTGRLQQQKPAVSHGAGLKRFAAHPRGTVRGDAPRLGCSGCQPRPPASRAKPSDLTAGSSARRPVQRARLTIYYKLG